VDELRKDQENRMAVLQYMVDKDIGDYRDFSSVIQMYATDPENVLELIKEGKPLIGGNR
jgi:hypothetical protein